MNKVLSNRTSVLHIWCIVILNIVIVIYVGAGSEVRLVYSLVCGKRLWQVHDSVDRKI